MIDVVRTERLTKRFGRAAVALDELDLRVETGSVYALVGPNGAGKTTTLRLLLNIIEPTSGHAEILGVDARRLRPADFARLGYVSENQDLPGWMSVRYLARYLKPFYQQWDDARLSELLDRLRVPLDRRVKDLSRGTTMKTALAVSLAYRPELLVLDEPFSGLDPLVRDELIEQLVDSARRTTLLISSHDLVEIESFATHVGYLDRGRLWCSETIGSLTDRFREIEVTSARTGSPRGPWPHDWLPAERAASVARFVDTRFDAKATMDAIRARFDDVVDINARPMSLREIFVALARTSPPVA